MTLIYWTLLMVAGLTCTKAQDLRATVEGPNFNLTHIVYICNLFDTGISNIHDYEVIFLFDNVEDSNVPRFIVSKGNIRVVLEEKYIIGKMRNQLKCKVRSYLKTDAARKTVIEVTSESFVNLGVVPEYTRSDRDDNNEINCKACVYESDKDPLKVAFETTIPFRCQNGSFNCEVIAKYTTSDNIVLKQPLDDKINPCEVTLVPSRTNGKANGEIYITAVKDDFNSDTERPNFIKMTFPAFPKVDFNGTLVDDNWNNFKYQIDIKHHNEKKAFCTVSGYSQVTTFDKYNYQMRGIGQFKYVDSTEGTPFAVQMRHWPCSLGSTESCVCGVAVQESGVDVVVDMCLDGTPHFINSACLLFPTDSGIKIIANAQKNRFAIIYPSGNSIYGSIVGRQMSLDLYVTPDKKNFLNGLCGLYGGDNKDATTVTDFDAWRIPAGQSIFEGKLKPLLALDDQKVTVSSEDEFCSCNVGVKTCSNSKSSYSSIDQYDYGMEIEVNAKVNGNFATCEFKRDQNYFPEEYKYFTAANAAYNQSWPTSSGISEDQAKAHCRNYLWDGSKLKALCSAVNNVDSFIVKCKREIQISGYLESAVNIEPELGRFCLFQGAATATKSGFDGLGKLKDLNDRYCESFSCSFNGVCEATQKCKCETNFDFDNTKDCSYNSTGMALNYRGPLCDVRTQECDHLLLSSQNIDSIFPECKFEVKEAFFNTVLEIFTPKIKQQGNVIDEDNTMCYTPRKYKQKIIASSNIDFFETISNKGTPILFDLSAYNDKSQSSDPVPALLYDSYCYNCTEDLTCRENDIKDGCRINGYCFKDKTKKPQDLTFHCDIALSLTTWSPVPVSTATPKVTAATKKTESKSETVALTTKATVVNTATTTSKTLLAVTTTQISSSDKLTQGPVASAPKVITKNSGSISPTITVKSVTNGVTSSPEEEEEEELGLLLENFLDRQTPTGDKTAVKEVSLALYKKLKAQPKCNGFEDKLKANPPDPNANLSLNENMKNLVIQYCAEIKTESENGNDSELENMTEELENLTNQIFTTPATTTITTTTTTTIAPQPNLEKDLADWLKNSDLAASADAIRDLMNKNPACSNSEGIAAAQNAPAYDKTASIEKNVYNLVGLYCQNNTAIAGDLISLLSQQNVGNSPSLPMDAIIGGVVGGLIGLGLLTLLCCFCGPILYRMCCPVVGTGFNTFQCMPQTCVPVATTCAPVCQPAQGMVLPTPGHCTTNVTTIVTGGNNFKPEPPKNYCGIAKKHSAGSFNRTPPTYLRPNYGCKNYGF